MTTISMSLLLKTHNLLHQYGTLCSFFVLIVITVLSLIPVTQEPPMTGIDKINHLVAYCALTFPISLSYYPRNKIIFFFSCCWGALIEILQSHVGRQADTIDGIVNSIGALLGIALAVLVIKALGTTPSPSNKQY